MGASSEYFRIRQLCKETGRLYEDPDFEPTSALYHNRTSKDEKIVWKRPTELSRKPLFIIDDRQYFDAAAGMQGNPALITALAALYEYRGMFYRTVPADQGFTEEFSYAGVFHFRFWWGAEWIEVMVDDRLPVIDNQLVYARSAGTDQYWAALLEKAYAKLHRSFEALSYSTLPDILSELTGGAAERIFVNPQANISLELFRALPRSTAFAIATTDDDKCKNGLLRGRPYAVVDLDQVRVDDIIVPLVRIRLPPPGDDTPFAGAWSNAHQSSSGAEGLSCLSGTTSPEDAVLPPSLPCSPTNRTGGYHPFCSKSWTGDLENTFVDHRCKARESNSTEPIAFCKTNGGGDCYCNWDDCNSMAVASWTTATTRTTPTIPTTTAAGRTTAAARTPARSTKPPIGRPSVTRASGPSDESVVNTSDDKDAGKEDEDEKGPKTFLVVLTVFGGLTCIFYIAGAVNEMRHLARERKELEQRKAIYTAEGKCTETTKLPERYTILE